MVRIVAGKAKSFAELAPRVMVSLGRAATVTRRE
jgi:hypothetical protein